MAFELSQKAKHLSVNALAGTGKTTTMIESLRVMQIGKTKKGFRFTSEGDDICSAICAEPAGKVGMFAYNRAIAQELKERVPHGVDASTTHSLGLKLVRSQFKLPRNAVDGDRTLFLIEEVTGIPLKGGKGSLWSNHREFMFAVRDLVSLCKQTLTGPAAPDFDPTKRAEEGLDPYALEEMLTLAAYYNVNLNGDADRVFETVVRVLEKSKDPAADLRIDFDDMIWLPVVLNIRPQARFRYDLLIGDEAQDLNRSRQELLYKCSERIVIVGDRHQAIYGFAGADTRSIERMEDHLQDTERGLDVLPLTKTFRCGREIVSFAQRYVPEYQAADDNPDGRVVRDASEDDLWQHMYQYEAGQPKLQTTEDMILCRTNAPLVGLCFRLILQKVRCYIQGRDIGKSLCALVKKSKADTVTELITWVDEWQDNEIRKIEAMKRPSESAKSQIRDRAECILMIAQLDDQIRPDDDPKVVCNRINELFDEEAGGRVRLSSVHRSKGLEAKRVWIIRPDLLPLPFVMDRGQDWEREQETNLEYVACTRAIDELYYVRSEDALETLEKKLSDADADDSADA